MRLRSTITLLFAMVLPLLVVAGVNAQETGVPLNVEAVTLTKPDAQRVPTMVVHDAAIPVQQPAQPAVPAANAAQAKKSPAMVEKANNGAKAGADNSASVELYSLSTTGNPAYDELVKKSAARHGVDPNLIMAVMRQESGFNPRARSYKGATGLMQLMPATARRFGVENIYDPAQNIDGGARYLRFLLDTFNGNVELALAGYNAGENAVVNSGYQIPRYRETQNYVRSISAKYGKNNKAVRVQTASAEPAAPTAITFSKGSRLSNNY